MVVRALNFTSTCCPASTTARRTLDESIALARIAVADGTGFVACTPHSEQVDVLTVPDRVHEVRCGAARRSRSRSRSRPAVRSAPARSLTDAELEILAQGPPGRRWVLLEAPLEPHRIDEFHAHADELEDRGYGLLIAHPERCAPLLAPGGGLEHACAEVRGCRSTRRRSPARTTSAAARRVRSRRAWARRPRWPPTRTASTARRCFRRRRACSARRGLADEPLIAGGPRRLLRAGDRRGGPPPAA